MQLGENSPCVYLCREMNMVLKIVLLLIVCRSITLCHGADDKDDIRYKGGLKLFLMLCVTLCITG